MAIEKILALASKYSYFNPILSKNRKNVVNLQLGHSGSLLQENIKTEWMNANVKNRNNDVHYFVYNNVEYNDKILCDSFNTVLKLCNKLPFGIATLYNKNKLNKDQSIIPESKYFQFETATILSSTLFLSSDDAMQYFLHWQRQRRLWWKKISSFPGRFHLGEIHLTDDNKSIVDICAEYSWGEQPLETLSISPFNNGTESCEQIMMISNTLTLEAAIVGLYFDAFNECSTQKSQELKINTKIAPYKCTFAVRCEDKTLVDELSQLALHLSKKFKKAGIMILLLLDSISSPVDMQFQRNDEWGIPYTLVVNDNTLKNGIIGLRNRDTSLEEEVHISNVTAYVLHIISSI